MDRRALLQWMVATGGLSAFTRLSRRDLVEIGDRAHRKTSEVGHVGMILSADEMRTVSSLAECIIPRTDTPGATDAGVAAFVDVMLAEWYPTDEATRFSAGLATVDATGSTRFGRSFAELSSAQQVELATALDNEVAALRRTSGARANEHWFAVLKYLAVWGFCTSEVGMRDVLKSVPRPMKYDGAAPVR